MADEPQNNNAHLDNEEISSLFDESDAATAVADQEDDAMDAVGARRVTSEDLAQLSDQPTRDYQPENLPRRQPQQQSSGPIRRATPEDNKIGLKDAGKLAVAGGKSLATENPEPLVKLAAEDPELARKVVAKGLDSSLGGKALKDAAKIPVVGKAVDTVDPRNWSINQKQTSPNQPPNDPVTQQNQPAGPAAPVQGQVDPYRQSRPPVKENPSSKSFLDRFRRKPDGKKKPDQEGEDSEGNEENAGQQGGGGAPGATESAAAEAAKKKAAEAKEKAAEQLLMKAGPYGAAAAAALKAYSFAKKHKNEIRIVLIFVLMFILIIVMSLISPASGSSLGSKPQSVSANAPFGGAPHCAEIQDTLDVKGDGGTGVHLTLSGSGTGRTIGDEPAVDATGTFSDPLLHDLPPLSLWADTLKKLSNTPVKKIQDNYVVARWPYQASEYTEPSSSEQKDPAYPQTQKTIFKGLPAGKDFAGAKIIIYNPATKKAVVGVAAGWNPVPNTRMPLAIDEAQEASWNNTSTGARLDPKTKQYFRIKDPPGYAGPVVGFTKTMAKTLGYADRKDVEVGDNAMYGFAVDQSLAPGTEVTCHMVSGGAGGEIVEGPNCVKYENATLTTYFPLDEPGGGGANDTFSRTVQSIYGYVTNQYTDSKWGNYVSLAGDMTHSDSPFYNPIPRDPNKIKTVYIPALENKFNNGQPITFKVTDTGGDIDDGASHLDVAAVTKAQREGGAPAPWDTMRNNGGPTFHEAYYIETAPGGCVRKASTGSSGSTGQFVRNTDTDVLLNTPGVKQHARNCNVAATISTVLNYNRNYHDDDLFTYGAGDTSVADKNACPAGTDGYLNAHTGFTDWKRVDIAKGNRANSSVWEAVKASIRGGDPVIMYGLPCAIYCSSKHLFTIVGYNTVRGTYYVNSSYTNPAGEPGVQARTDSIDGLITEDRLQKYLDFPGSGVNNHSFYMRAKYASGI